MRKILENENGSQKENVDSEIKSSEEHGESENNLQDKVQKRLASENAWLQLRSSFRKPS